jgi:hypothetical protein
MKAAILGKVFIGMLFLSASGGFLAPFLSAFLFKREIPQDWATGSLVIGAAVIFLIGALLAGANIRSAIKQM